MTSRSWHASSARTAAPLAFLAIDAFERRRTIEQLTDLELADPAIVYGLRRLLASDRDVAVRALAAGALGSVRTRALDVTAFTMAQAPDGSTMPEVVPWLVDALADTSPVVRDAAIRALARHAAVVAYAPLCMLARTDTTWWVRRAAIYALGVIGASDTSSTRGSAEASGATSSGRNVADPIAPARAALADPFWRVRHAAIQVLSIYGNRAPERRAEILAHIEGGTGQYLSALWGPTLIEDRRAPIVSRLPLALLDRDPAVVTARLAEMESPPPLAIVELLCDPHVPLRTLAATRLMDGADADAFAASLNWLDEPRIPHVAATVTTMLDSLGDAARELASRVLSAPARPGASRWAIGWVVATRYMDLAPLAWARAVELDDRALAMSLAPVPELVDVLRSPEVVPRSPDMEEPRSVEVLHSPTTHRSREVEAIAAADELGARPARDRRVVLDTIEPHWSSAVRMRLAAAAGLERDVAIECNVAIECDAAIERDASVDAAIERNAGVDLAIECRAAIERDVTIQRPVAIDGAVKCGAAAVHKHLDAAFLDNDPLARATALSLAGARLSITARALALADVDPAVREAVVARATLEELDVLLGTERDPWVRRSASRVIARAVRDARRGSASLQVDSAHRRRLTERVVQLSADADEWIRTLVVPFLDASQADQLARIVALAADTSAMVQSAIVEKLAEVDEAHLAAAAADTTAATAATDPIAADTATSRAIDAWIATRDRDAVLSASPARWARRPATARTNTDVDRRDTDVSPTDIPLFVDDRNPGAIPRRSFGSSGVLTTPLVISGAFDLQPGSLRAAAERGVTTYFWEPAYAGMTRFLRSKRERVRSQVVTGTYHADARSIEKDVERALRRLGRDTIDVYLLFWSRSDARLDEHAFAVMDGLRRAGKVRAIGFSTHDRELATRALDAAAWDVVMTRHSAAHPGIETGFLAHAKAKGVGVITFTALCYGRMLKGDSAPTAQDCYRYSIAQDGVTATISAPRRHRELVENLEVLGARAMTDEEVARVRAHGAAVRVESQKFNALVRQPTRDAAAAAMAMLEDALAPAEGDRDEACVTPEALQRSLGSRGRGRASLPSAMLRRGRL
ncbi:MAG: aldo/keto reductase [Kofleriaceae bacterium]